MARALMGHLGLPNEHVLAYEVTRLRRRIAELETEVEHLREHRTDLDLELHEITGAAQPVPA